MLLLARHRMPAMDLERFRYLLDAYGPDLRRWPPAEQAAADALLRRSTEAARAMREARSFDQALSATRQPVAEGAVERVLAHVAEPAAQPGARRRAWPVSWAPALLAAMAALGFLAGLADPEIISDAAQVPVRGVVFGGIGL
jgi:hypothetical protein